MQDVGGNWIAIPPTIKVEFHITRGSQSSSPDATFKLYNLSDATRQGIYKDPYLHLADGSPIRRGISFWAGYNDSWFNEYLTESSTASTPPVVPPPPGCALAFTGYIDFCRSYRQGPDWITEIHAWDGGPSIQFATTSRAYPAGTTYELMIANLCTDFSKYNQAVIAGTSYGSFTPAIVGQPTSTGVIAVSTPDAITALKAKTLTKAMSINGSTWNAMLNLLKDVPSVQVVIEKGQLRFSTAQEGFINGQPDGGIQAAAQNPAIVVIDDTVGIIGIPYLSSIRMEMECFLLTQVALRDRVFVKVSPNYGDNNSINGLRLVLMIEHYGTISPSAGGDARTYLNMQSGDQPVLPDFQ